jgi:hypothetical protein
VVVAQEQIVVEECLVVEAVIQYLAHLLQLVVVVVLHGMVAITCRAGQAAAHVRVTLQ